MGGNALKPLKTKRLNKTDFDHATKKVVSVLSRAIKSVNSSHGSVIKYQPYEVKAYRLKETFGDLDLLVESTLFKHYTREQMLSEMAVEFDYEAELPFKRNGPVLSFGVPSDEADVFFQVDVISTSQEDFLCHGSYLNWNDLGNLVGVVASKTKVLKHGHDGLYYVLRDGNHQFGEVRLTNDYLMALEFLGYEPSRYNEGFDTLMDVYEYAASSKFFNPKLYSFEERNHDQRMRDRKRPTYNGFLTWIEEQEKEGLFVGRVHLDMNGWNERVYSFFPWFKAESEKRWLELENKREVRKFFNGELVMALKPELSGPELGKYMDGLRKVENDFEGFVLSHKEDAVKLLVDKFDSSPS